MYGKSTGRFHKILFVDWIFSIHLFLTLYMTGLIWFVQVVHYPLMGKVGREAFVSYERAHTRLTSWVTAPQMVAELATGAWLWYESMGINVFGLNFLMILLLWMSTFFIQVPLHNHLSRVFSEKHHRRLARTNWIRTALWTARGVLLLVHAAGNN